MATGWNTKRIGQIGEFLFCAEVARQSDCIATPFAGNVPIFDVLVTDEQCRTIPVQVKTAGGGAWQFDAFSYTKITFKSESKTQVVEPRSVIDHPDLVLALLRLAPLTDENQRHRFFILTRRDLHRIIFSNHSRWLEKHGGHRPKNWESTHCSVSVSDIEHFENNWPLITELLAKISPQTSTSSAPS